MCVCSNKYWYSPDLNPNVQTGSAFENALQHISTHFNTLQHSATHCSTLQHSATHCNTLQHTATLCNTLQHSATHWTHYNTLQHTATHHNTLQHTATHWPIATLPKCAHRQHTRTCSFTSRLKTASRCSTTAAAISMTKTRLRTRRSSAKSFRNSIRNSKISATGRISSSQRKIGAILRATRFGTGTFHIMSWCFRAPPKIKWWVIYVHIRIHAHMHMHTHTHTHTHAHTHAKNTQTHAHACFMCTSSYVCISYA